MGVVGNLIEQQTCKQHLGVKTELSPDWPVGGQLIFTVATPYVARGVIAVPAQCPLSARSVPAQCPLSARLGFLEESAFHAIKERDFIYIQTFST